MGDDIAVTLTHGGKTLETTMEGIERLADHLTDAKRKALEGEGVTDVESEGVAMSDSELVQLRDAHFTVVSDEASRQRLHLKVEATALCLKFVGAFATAHDKTEPADRRFAAIETDEDWWDVAASIRHEAERLTGYEISCSAGCGAMDKSIVGALKTFAAQHTDAKRKALQAERARVQAQLDALDEKLK